jgi:thiosulfate dehydrogenase [quinone] large subunit
MVNERRKGIMAQTLTRAQGFEEPGIAKFIFSDPRMSVFWLVVRIYAGWQWLEAGWEKFNSPVWTGNQAGTAMSGFVGRALQQTTGDHPNVQGWYAGFLQTFVQPYTVQWSYAITFGEILVGLGLIVGLFTGIAAFFGGLMNANFLLAGSVSTNPMLFVLATWLVLAWRGAGLIGLDRFALPMMGVPGQPGKLLRHEPRAARMTAAPAH